ncbi:MAG: hypothetical protein M3Y72_01380 [Acidobacteriota bacterium]|nr:hypothetical protein [Acidobacteriota bacterium]
MANTLDQYRQAKHDILKLRGAAKKELIGRFHELANELLVVQKELREEFNVKLAIPSKPKSSRPKKAPAVESKKAEKPTSTSPEITAIERKLAAQKRKLDGAAKSGKPDKLIRDRIYELEDELRLAKEK